MKLTCKALAAVLALALGMLPPLGLHAGSAFAQSEDRGEKQRRLGALIAEALPASRVPEIYADLRRVMRDVYLPTIEEAAKNELPGKRDQDAETIARMGKLATFFSYALRASDEAEPFLADRGQEMIADFAGLFADYLTRAEIEAFGELLDMPAMRKVFNTFHAASQLVTGYSYREFRDYYGMSAWIQELEFNLGEDGPAKPNITPPSAEQIAKAQNILEDFLRVSRLDEMVTKITGFVRTVQLTSRLIPEEQREQIKTGLEQFEFVYNLQKSMMMAIAPSMIAAMVTSEQLDKLHLLVLSPVMAKTFGLIDNLVREATSFTSHDIEAVQEFADRAEANGLFKERGAEEKARFEAEAEALGDLWRERLMQSLSPETREGLERSRKEIEALKEDEDDDDEGAGEDRRLDRPAPGQRDL